MSNIWCQAPYVTKEQKLKFLILGIAGAFGTISRYLLDGFVHQILGPQFPYGTLTVNITGCLLIGFLGTLADEKFLFTPQWRLFLLLGFLGAFTTFSSFAYETWNLFKEDQFFLAGLNVCLNVVVCFVSLIAGVLSARLI